MKNLTVPNNVCTFAEKLNISVFMKATELGLSYYHPIKYKYQDIKAIKVNSVLWAGKEYKLQYPLIVYISNFNIKDIKELPIVEQMDNGKLYGVVCILINGKLPCSYSGNIIPIDWVEINKRTKEFRDCEEGINNYTDEVLYRLKLQDLIINYWYWKYTDNLLEYDERLMQVNNNAYNKSLDKLGENNYSDFVFERGKDFTKIEL